SGAVVGGVGIFRAGKIAGIGVAFSALGRRRLVRHLGPFAGIQRPGVTQTSSPPGRSLRTVDDRQCSRSGSPPPRDALPPSVRTHSWSTAYGGLTMTAEKKAWLVFAAVVLVGAACAAAW